MGFHSISHIAICVKQLKQAEAFYRQVFGMQVAFREAETEQGWASLPPDADWSDAEAAGIELQLAVLVRDGVTLALELGTDVTAESSTLSHIGLFVGEPELEQIRSAVQRLECDVTVNRPSVLVFADPHGIVWEIASTFSLRSTGERTGQWLTLPHRSA